MSHHDNDPSGTHIHDHLAIAREQLRKAITDPENIVYAESDGPLPIEMVEPARLSDPAFQEVVTTYGWPTVTDDGIIEPANRYPTSYDFLDTLRPSDEYGPRRISSIYFYNLISVKHIRNLKDAETGHDVHGVNPVLHRAHALAPDLFDSLLVVTKQFKDEYGGIYEGDDKLFEQFRKPENRDIVDAIYMAYRIMGTLLKVDDYERRGSVAGLSDISLGLPPIISADEELRFSK